MLDLQKIQNSRVFLVGAGGIGCELLKTLALSGFKNIDLIDLDTIEISNLNRQFLFQKTHVGKSKALVARESILKYRPNLNINAYHDSITEIKYDVNFFKQYDLVLSALDSISVRYHLNRMCLAADVVLIESGTQGFLGQTKPIFRGISECYDCLPRSSNKTQYASCTIRNTPSEPVHCIVWAKNLYNVLFGVESDEDSISPEIQIESGEKSLDLQKCIPNGDLTLNQMTPEKTNNHVDPTNIEEPKTALTTHQWAIRYDYNPKHIAEKLYKLDIKYLLSMGDLWVKRKAPVPLENLDELFSKITTTLVEGQVKRPQENSQTLPSNVESEHRHVWNLDKSAHIFSESVTELYDKLIKLKKQQTTCETSMDSTGDHSKVLPGAAGDGKTKIGLTWDKDDNLAMNFVTAAANIRSYVFGIKPLSFFDTKSIAGNIIPAISTTNAIIAGLIVSQACFILSDLKDKCKTLFLRTPISNKFRNQLIGREQLRAPNPNCFSCAAKPQVFLKTDLETFTLNKLVDVLKKDLFMGQPDVTIDDGKGTVLLSSDEEDEQDLSILNNPLSSFGLKNNQRLVCDDFSQNYELVVILIHDITMNPKDHQKSSQNDPDTNNEIYKDYVIAGDFKALMPNNVPGDEDRSTDVTKENEIILSTPSNSRTLSSLESSPPATGKRKHVEILGDFPKTQFIQPTELTAAEILSVNGNYTAVDISSDITIEIETTNAALSGEDTTSLETAQEVTTSSSEQLRTTFHESKLQLPIEFEENEVIDLVDSSSSNGTPLSDFSRSSLDDLYEGNYQGEIQPGPSKRLKSGTEETGFSNITTKLGTENLNILLPGPPSQSPEATAAPTVDDDDDDDDVIDLENENGENEVVEEITSNSLLLARRQVTIAAPSVLAAGSDPNKDPYLMMARDNLPFSISPSTHMTPINLSMRTNQNSCNSLEKVALNLIKKATNNNNNNLPKLKKIDGVSISSNIEEDEDCVIILD